MTSKIEICNLALSRLGDKAAASNIDKPGNPAETAFAKWYEITRESSLRRNMPAFAIKRELWQPSGGYAPVFYERAYKIPPQCLKIIGVGEIADTVNDYAVEGGYLFCDRFRGALPVRYVENVKNTDRFTPDFIELLSWELARNVCTELTNDVNMLQYIDNAIKQARIELSGVSAQENRPLRITGSRYDRTGFLRKDIYKK